MARPCPRTTRETRLLALATLGSGRFAVGRRHAAVLGNCGHYKETPTMYRACAVVSTRFKPSRFVHFPVNACFVIYIASTSKFCNASPARSRATRSISTANSEKFRQLATSSAIFEQWTLLRKRHLTLGKFTRKGNCYILLFCNSGLQNGLEGFKLRTMPAQTEKTGSVDTPERIPAWKCHDAREAIKKPSEATGKGIRVNNSFTIPSTGRTHICLSAQFLRPLRFNPLARRPARETFTDSLANRY